MLGLDALLGWCPDQDRLLALVQTACLCVIALSFHRGTRLLAQAVAAIVETLEVLRTDERATSSRASANIEAAPSGVPAAPSERSPVARSAREFAACLLGDTDVDTGCFMHACRSYCSVLEQIGPFTLLSIREAPLL